jgi:hypothetical protein
MKIALHVLIPMNAVVVYVERRRYARQNSAMAEIMLCKSRLDDLVVLRGWKKETNEKAESDDIIIQRIPAQTFRKTSRFGSEGRPDHNRASFDSRGYLSSRIVWN